MDIKTMKRLDYWLGIPLCFLLTIIRRVRDVRISAKAEHGAVNKILFVKLSELGAIVLSWPLLSKIKNDYPQAELYFVTFEKNRDIFKALGQVIPDKNVFVVRQDSFFKFSADLVRIILRLRRIRVDVVFDLEFFSRLGTIFSYLSGAKKRVGLYGWRLEGLYRGGLLTHKVAYSPLNHISRTFLSFVQVIREESKETPELKEMVDSGPFVFPRHIPDAQAARQIKLKLKDLGVSEGARIVLVNPGEGILGLREWPLRNFVDLCRLILRDKGNSIAIVGTEGACAKGDSLLGELDRQRCVNLVGKTSLPELFELFDAARVLVSNDCGIAHLAMLSGIKKIVIFGPESPQVFAPLGENTSIVYSNWPCSPCLSVLNHRSSDCQNNMCLKAIRPEDVYGLVASALSK